MIIALDDDGLILCVVGWNPFTMALQSSRGHYKCKSTIWFQMYVSR